MKKLIYLGLATILSGTVMLSCKKQANSIITTKQNTNVSLNNDDNSNQLKMGGDQFGGNDCAENGNYCAPEVIIWGICSLNDIVLASNNAESTSNFFKKNKFKNIDSNILDMLIDGSATLKLEIVTDEVGYFSVTNPENEVIIIPFK